MDTESLLHVLGLLSGFLGAGLLCWDGARGGLRLTGSGNTRSLGMGGIALGFLLQLISALMS